jgi:hypothetical protein
MRSLTVARSIFVVMNRVIVSEPRPLGSVGHMIFDKIKIKPEAFRGVAQLNI